MEKLGPDILLEKAKDSFIRAGEQCDPDRVARKLANDLHAANLKLQEADESKKALAEYAFVTGFWAATHRPKEEEPNAFCEITLSLFREVIDESK